MGLAPVYSCSYSAGECLSTREPEIAKRTRPSASARSRSGAHYGGSPYSMTDPFYMLVLIENLGREHIVGGQD